ncbi:MAG: CPBP family intramembrane metalloprotease [Oscillospiraceae bacterium]|nr:CPBP family intramembrane metalloprotease [Oscillospiraceae bacterium]
MNYYGQPGGQNGGPPPPQLYYPYGDDASPDEKKKIRRNFNTIGIVLLALYILTAAVCMTAYIFFAPDIVYNEYGQAVYGLADMIIGGCFPAAMAIIVFAVYCAVTGYSPGELFRTENLNGRQIGKYVMMTLFFQQVSMICTIIMSNGLYSLGLEVSGLNYVIERTPSVYAADIISAVILAPIGEELIYRGVVLRCAAKVSQRFAIFFSAFIFGIMHGNPYQFVLGFLLGIPMAIVTIKTGSLIPAIICHMANNALASIPSVVEYFNEDAAFAVNVITIPVFLILGLVVFASEAASGGLKLPAYTEFHKKRTFPVLVTSWSMILITVIYIADLIMSIQPIEEMPEMIEQTARLILRS